MAEWLLKKMAPTIGHLTTDWSLGDLTYTHFIASVCIGDSKSFHSPYHGIDGHEDILVHQLGEGFSVFFCVTCSVDNSHLFDEGALPTLSRPCK